MAVVVAAVMVAVMMVVVVVVVEVRRPNAMSFKKGMEVLRTCATRRSNRGDFAARMRFASSRLRYRVVEGSGCQRQRCKGRFGRV